MIDISKPGDVIGRKVIYHPGWPDSWNQKPEEGVITEIRISSTNEPVVFVRYGADIIAKATRPTDLEFIA